MLRFLFWRLLGVAGALVGVAAAAWLLQGGVGRALREAGGVPQVPHVLHGHHQGQGPHTPQGGLGGVAGADNGMGSVATLADVAGAGARSLWTWAPGGGLPLVQVCVALALAAGLTVALVRWQARAGRRYVRLRMETYRSDRASGEALVALFEVLHKRISSSSRRGRRLLLGQQSVALEVHYSPQQRVAWLAVACPAGLERMVEAAIQTAYGNCLLRREQVQLGDPPVVLRLRKRSEFIKRCERWMCASVSREGRLLV